MALRLRVFKLEPIRSGLLTTTYTLLRTPFPCAQQCLASENVAQAVRQYPNAHGARPSARTASGRCNRPQRRSSPGERLDFSVLRDTQQLVPDLPKRGLRS